MLVGRKAKNKRAHALHSQRKNARAHVTHVLCSALERVPARARCFGQYRMCFSCCLHSSYFIRNYYKNVIKQFQQ